MAPEPTCRMCDGTKKVVVMNSWFTSDGFRRLKCWMCQGVGRTRERAGTEAEKHQRHLRSLATKPRTPKDVTQSELGVAEGLNPRTPENTP